MQLTTENRLAIIHLMGTTCGAEHTYQSECHGISVIKLHPVREVKNALENTQSSMIYHWLNSESEHKTRVFAKILSVNTDLLFLTPALLHFVFVVLMLLLLLFLFLL